MTEKNTIHDLEAQAKNTRYLIDRLNRAHYGMTVDEIIKSIGGGRNDNRAIRPVQSDSGEAEYSEGSVRRTDDPDTTE